MNCILIGRKIYFSSFLVIISICCNAQELFSVTEPASNRPVGSAGFRLDNSVMDEINSSRINYHMIPGIMIGVTKSLTISGSLFFSNRSGSFKKEGGSVYAKYRFMSKDDIQKHFRMAAFTRLSINNSDIHQEEVEMYGHNTGMELGIVATKLTRKIAVSSDLSFARAIDNLNGNKFIYGSKYNKVVNYALSIGKLMLPQEYKAYKQINLNCMVELLSQVNTGSGKYYFDVAPIVQLIFNSQSRIDIGYRKELGSSMIRTAPTGFLIRMEHTLFNIF